MAKVSDYVADFIAGLGVRHVFSVPGGGCMHLTDSIGHHEELSYVACHHEQAAAMAAEAYSRLNGVACCLVTTGPGGTNAITGVACAWIDSMAVVFISGQVMRNQMIGSSGVRQMGVQETNIVELVRPITKYAVSVQHEGLVRYELAKAAYLATHGRQGPVWLDIPLDVQAKQMPEDDGENVFVPDDARSRFGTDGRFHWDLPVPQSPSGEQAQQCLTMLRDSKRPVLIVGNGVRLAGAESQVCTFIWNLGIPVVASWATSDMIAYDNPCYIGHMGIFGDRAGNFAVQNADLLLVIGCRLSVPMIGYDFAAFAPRAKIIMVDVDEREITKPSLHVDLPIVADAKAFVSALLPRLPLHGPCFGCEECPATWTRNMWRNDCLAWKSKYPVILPEYAEQKQYVNSFYFIDQLAQRLGQDAIVVLDQGTAFTCTQQAFKWKLGQRLVVSGGHAAMGYGLPAAVGAAFATGKIRKIICIVGDGDLQFNIQELQTIVHHRLPIIIFVLNNGGYLTIKAMQDNHFKRRTGSDAVSGVSFPDLDRIACAYGINSTRHDSHEMFGLELDAVLAQRGPFICEIMMDPEQPLIPRVQSHPMPDGSIKPGSLEDMYPFLDRKEFKQNIIAPVVGTTQDEENGS